MKTLIGILIIVIGGLMIYFQLKKNLFYENEKREDFYIGPEIRSFWGITAILIFGGFILIIQDLS